MAIPDCGLTEIAGCDCDIFDLDKLNRRERLAVDGLIVDHLVKESRQQRQVRRKWDVSNLLRQADHCTGQGQVGSRDVWMAQPIDGRLDVPKADLE